MKARNNNHNVNHVPVPTLRRLPGYLSYFKSLKINGVDYVSSSQIAITFKMDHTLVTKDLAHTGVKGRTKVGYQVDQLIDTLINFLDFNSHENAFLFGVGNLGKALINYDGLTHYGLKIIAGFDVDKNITGQSIKDVKIHHLDAFRDLSIKTPARIAIITTPDDGAQEVADLAVAWGIKAIWNFTPQSIRVPAHVIVENTSIYSDLAVIFNRLNK